MSFTQAIESGFKNYVNLNGRTRRSGYWYWVLFNVLVTIVLWIVDAVTGIGVLAGIFGLVTLLPSLGVGVRRLHDIDKSGWFVLLSLIPIVGLIILIVWACQAGTRGANRFGPDPAA